MYTEKEQVRCVMVVRDWRIEGDMHVLSGSRLTDALNSKAKDFLAVTNVKVYDARTGDMLFTPPYIAVNRESIACIFPLEE